MVVVAVGGESAPPNAKARDEVPVPAKPVRAVAKSATSVQVEPSHDSVVA